MSANDNMPQKKKDSFIEFVRALLIAGLMAVGIRTVLYENFVIPSGSMKPTLLIGDFLFVSKFAYGYSHYSLPFSPPLFSGRIWGQEPKRGDVVVFRPPFDPKTDFIKRVVGLPGDKVQMIEGILYLNDKPCPLEKQSDTFKDHLYLDYSHGGEPTRVRDADGNPMDQYTQTLPGGVKHTILKEKSFGSGRFDNTAVFNVPPGHFFVMGDNRDGSDDSRNANMLGFVPFENLIGEASLIFFSTDARIWEFWRWPLGLRFRRLLTIIR